ncbi:hypothetical protein GOBAR_AA10278 [Gossypium barbadense]|uniref:Uncharacterized protein n=1 Tax=Gossypium barbadense TaxID=3634 RepID=A0A2P5Y479_GOSBA|nr:hypothetical protein GOBAR_AA10278 [Gossypium barbadense]
MKIMERKGWTNVVVLGVRVRWCVMRGGRVEEEGEWGLSGLYTVASTRPCPQAVWCTRLRRTAVCTIVRFSDARVRFTTPVFMAYAYGLMLQVSIAHGLQKCPCVYAV